ncbi:MAG: DUF1838 domain-containing protein [Gammaproteobacteria bacterium]|nr:DUF1838 domain-containing protein [Gammaproteobacteria bacterium]
MKRRTVIAGLAGLATAPNMMASRSAKAATSLPAALDPANRAHLGLLQKKLMYSMDDRPLIWWTRGKKYGSINGEITPLWTLNVLIFKSVKHRDDGTFDTRMMELVYKTDVETDELLSSWRNPYSGEEYEEVPLIMGPLNRRISDEGPLSQSALPGANIQRSGELGPAEIAGDEVWLSSDSHVLVKREDGSTFRANDLNTYHGRVSDVLNPELPSAPATISTTLVQSWHPWMNMGDREGTLVTRLAGAKCFKVEDIHPRIRTLLRQGHPEIAEDFVGRLAAPPERFDR